MGFQIYVREENRKLPVSVDTLMSISLHAYMLMKKEAKDISLVVCDDEFIRRLNKKYMKRNMPTDVLSFSMEEGELGNIESPVLGDIIISLDTTEKQAAQLGESAEEEFFILYTHGLLHLLGLDHEKPDEEKEMKKYTSEILSEVMERS